MKEGIEDVDQKHFNCDLWDLHKHFFQDDISERSIN